MATIGIKLNIVVTYIGEKFEARLLNEDGADLWRTSSPMEEMDLVEHLTSNGCHLTDVYDAILMAKSPEHVIDIQRQSKELADLGVFPDFEKICIDKSSNRKKGWNRKNWPYITVRKLAELIAACIIFTRRIQRTLGRKI